MGSPAAHAGFHAVVLAGGRSARLGGRPKAGLRRDGRTLLELTLDAVRDAAGAVVVGPEGPALPEGVLRTREEPPFAGPAAGIAAGLRVLETLPPVPWTFTLACDMPGLAAAVALLRDAARRDPGGPGFLAVTPDGQRQPLLALYRSEVLRGAYAGRQPAGRSVRSFVRDLPLGEVTVPEEAAADVDTWDDVLRHHLS